MYATGTPAGLNDFMIISWGLLLCYAQALNHFYLKKNDQNKEKKKVAGSLQGGCRATHRSHLNLVKKREKIKYRGGNTLSRVIERLPLEPIQSVAALLRYWQDVPYHSSLSLLSFIIILFVEWFPFKKSVTYSAAIRIDLLF